MNLLPNDLIEGIQQILSINYPEQTLTVLGITFSKHRNVAILISQVLDEARKRDKVSLARELDLLSGKLKQ